MQGEWKTANKKQTLESVHQLFHFAVFPPIKNRSNNRCDDLKYWPEDDVNGYVLSQITIYTEPVKPEIIKARQAIGIKSIHSMSDESVASI